MIERCGAGGAGFEGFSKDANSASNSLSGEGFLGASSLCVVVDTGVGLCVVSEGANSETGVAVEPDDHHQPMIAMNVIVARKSGRSQKMLCEESPLQQAHVTSLVTSNFPLH
jgi:hypothetical protein